MTETLEQIALRIDTTLTNEGKTAISAAYAIEFAKRLVDAIGAQEPAEYRYKFHDTFSNGFVWKLRPTYNGQDPIETQPLYAAPKLGEVK